MQSDSRRNETRSMRSVVRAYQHGDSLPIPASASIAAHDRIASYPVMLARAAHPPSRHTTQAPHRHSACSRAGASVPHTRLSLHVAALHIHCGPCLAHYALPSRSRVTARPGPDSARRPDYSARPSPCWSPFLHAHTGHIRTCAYWPPLPVSLLVSFQPPRPSSLARSRQARAHACPLCCVRALKHPLRACARSLVRERMSMAACAACM